VACDLQIMAILAWRTGRFAPDPMRCYQSQFSMRGVCCVDRDGRKEADSARYVREQSAMQEEIMA
jgi:hypothetical protein